MNNSIEERVMKNVRLISFLGDEVKKDDEFAAIGVNSIDMVDLVVMIEDEFQIRFDDSVLNMENFRLVEDLINLVVSQIKRNREE